MVNKQIDFATIPTSIIPNKIQYHALMAAISDFTIAKEHWQLLKEALDLDGIDFTALEENVLAQLYDRLDMGSRRLLPMIYKNLENLTEDLLLQSIKSFYRYTWARNHYFLEQAKKIAKIGEEFGIDVIFLKGLALAFYYADDKAIRVMEDVDVLIDPSKVDLVLKHLTKYYKAKESYRLMKALNLLHAATFIVDKSEVDIHWQMLYSNQNWQLCKEKDYIVNTNIGENIKVLTPNYAFFHTLAHGLQPNFVPTIRWIADCYLIQKKHAIDWQVIISLADRLGYNMALKVAVAVLPNYGIDISKEIIEQIENLPLDTRVIKMWTIYQSQSLVNRWIGKRITDGIILRFYENRVYKQGVLQLCCAFIYRAILLVKKSWNHLQFRP